MPRTLLVLAAATVLFSVVGCSTPADTPPKPAGTQQPGSDVQQPSLRQQFLSNLELIDGQPYSAMPKDQATQVVLAAMNACQQLDEGTAPRSVAALVKVRDDRPQEQAELVVQTAVDSFCPKYGALDFTSTAPAG